MKNVYYFLRHAEVKKDSNIHATLWGLSEFGVVQAREIAENEMFNDIDLIITSTEIKAHQTAEPIAKKLKLEIIEMSNFCELGRGEKYLTLEEFEKLKKAKLEDLDCDLDGGETGREALKRFEYGIKSLEDLYSGKKIIIVSHGTILSLYFAKVKNDFSDIFKRWKNLEFCAFGIIGEDKIIKDIV
ncbi:MAG: histidine phosphatase family protein [Candidatus Magasanikbacteria bacterium]|nr:histidine phosphatase family protein [Candidatus Magasanikbacteria bacterium]